MSLILREWKFASNLFGQLLNLLRFINVYIHHVCYYLPECYLLVFRIENTVDGWGHFLLKNAKSQYVSRYRRISSGSETETDPNIYYSLIIRYT